MSAILNAASCDAYPIQATKRRNPDGTLDLILYYSDVEHERVIQMTGEFFRAGFWWVAGYSLSQHGTLTIYHRPERVDDGRSLSPVESYLGQESYAFTGVELPEEITIEG